MASSSARCIAGTPARSSSWCRQDSPSASTTAPGFGADRRQQVGLGDRDGDVVVPLLHPEVPGQPAAAGDPGDGRPGPAQQPLVGVPAEHRRVVAVRLRHDLDAGEVGRRPVEPRRAARRGSARRPRPRPPAGRRSAPRRQCAAWPGTTARARRRARRSRRTAPASRPSARRSGAGPVELSGGEPGQAAAGVLRDHPDAQPGGLEEPDRGVARSAAGSGR